MPESADAAVAEILVRYRTPGERIAALGRSAELTYGVDPRTDEEVEITTAAAYLQAAKQGWRAELASRAAGNAPKRPGWEAFQQEMDAFAPEDPRTEEVWFLQESQGYQVTGRNRDELAALGAAREQVPADDPQQLLGFTYQRDTMYAIRPEGAISRHVGTFDATAPAERWTGGVVRVQADGEELRLRLDAVAADGALRGSVVEGPVSNRGLAVGSAVELRRDANGVLTIDSGARREQLAEWTGSFETAGYHQGRTRLNEGAGMHVPGAGTPEARNRGGRYPTDDAMFEQIRARFRNVDDPEHGYARTLGPARTPLNVEATGWEIVVPAYRRLGGDALFFEAEHAERAAYRPELPVPATVDVENPNWFNEVSNALPDRFVGGRSSSATLYMTAATMLVHEGKLSQDEASELMAFTAADMVVSGEHSLPECLAPMTMAASASQPWQGTELNLAKETPALTTWMQLVGPEAKQGMRAETQTALLKVLENPAPDPKLVRNLAMVLKATEPAERSPGDEQLAHAFRAGLNPVAAKPQQVAAATGERPRTTAVVRDAGRDR
ncbi:hypothetical protein HPO96_08960 [Kribbella sandramycini]|uniref:Uncharacterized protein n=1 Tax=Kribbella sandramycini TaxID=60450 RepID=A0A7Y4KXC4_9ACTN|nr:hypothetical protein [Kribbella sandramycini]MBB6569800.1 hypothetical protein [Kribbella sandramycini]NOL40373.1 hypothetical protein [Kribbella sandramycini]